MGVVRNLITRLSFSTDTRGLRKYNNAVGNVNNKAKELKYTMLALGAAIGAGSGYILKAAGEMEQFGFAFEVMLGGAGAGKKMMSDLRELTLRTPFSFRETTEGAKRLLAMGVEAEGVVGTLESLGNIAAGVGREKLPQLILALGQVKSAGILRGQELRQFAEAGVGLAAELEKITGYPIKRIVSGTSRLGITYKQVAKALGNLTKKGGKFYNLMIRQSKTLLGMVAIIKDKMYLWAADMGDSFIPAIKNIINSMGGLNVVFDRFKGLLSITALLTFSGAIMGLIKMMLGLKIATLGAFFSLALPLIAVGFLILGVQSLWKTLNDPKADTMIRRIGDYLKNEWPKTFATIKEWWEDIIKTLRTARNLFDRFVMDAEISIFRSDKSVMDDMPTIYRAGPIPGDSQKYINSNVNKTLYSTANFYIPGGGTSDKEIMEKVTRYGENLNNALEREIGPTINNSKGDTN